MHHFINIWVTVMVLIMKRNVAYSLFSLKERGVDAHFTLFKGSQFNKIGHLWDNMKSATGDWHGKPEGPWKMHQDDNYSG